MTQINAGNITIPQEVLDQLEDILQEQMEKEELVNKAKKWISDFGVKHRFTVFARNIDLNRPKKNTRFEFGVGGSSYTDGKMIRGALDENWLDKPEVDWVRYMKFVLAHEMSHVNWSDFKIFRNFQKRAESYFDKKYDIQGAGRFAGDMLNITEDGRIERALVNSLRGMLKYVKYVNGVTYENFDSNYLGIVPLHDFRNVSLTLSKVGLLPKGYDKRIVGTETDKAIKKAMPYIAKAIRAETAKECADATWEMILENEEFLAKAMEPFEMDEEELQDMLGEDMSDDSEESDNSESSDDSSGGGQGNQQSQSNDDNEGSDKSSDSNKKPSDNEEGDAQEGQGGGDEDDSQDGEDASGNEGGSDENGQGDEEDSSGDGDGQEDEEEGSQEGDGNSSSNEQGRKITINPLDNMEGEADYNNQPSMGKAPQGNESAHFGKESDLENGDAQQMSLNRSDDENSNNKAENTLEELIVLTEDESIEFLEKAKQAATRENDRLAREQAEREKTDVSNKEINGVLSEYKRNLDFVYTEERFNNHGPVREDIKRTGRGLRRDLKEIFNDKRGWTLANQRAGMLDESQLYRAGSQLQQNDVFIKRQLPEDSSWVVSILVDNSGSMTGAVHDENGAFLGRKTTIARHATSVLEIALNGLVPLKITRFDVAFGSKVQHARVRGWEQKTNDVLSWNSTDNAGHLNADAMSIGVAVEELKKRPESKKLLIVLSDGLPSANTPEQVTKVVEKSRKEGIKIVGIGFGPEDELRNNKQTYHQMYGQDLVLTMPDGLSKELVKVLRATIARGF